MDVLFVVSTLVTMPFWLLLLVAPGRMATVRAVHAIWVFFALAALYVVLLAMNSDASATSLFTLEGYKELQASAAAVLAGWIHYLSLDLFAGAWSIYLLVRLKRTGVTSLDGTTDMLAAAR